MADIVDLTTVVSVGVTPDESAANCETALKSKYDQCQGYSRCGQTLMATNMRGKDADDRPLVDLVNDAFARMFTENKHQTIVTLGESGSGKSYTAQQMIATLAHNAGSESLSGLLEQAAVVLRAFGNAATTQNDDSSRVGITYRL